MCSFIYGVIVVNYMIAFSVADFQSGVLCGILDFSRLFMVLVINVIRVLCLFSDSSVL